MSDTALHILEIIDRDYHDGSHHTVNGIDMGELKDKVCSVDEIDGSQFDHAMSNLYQIGCLYKPEEGVISSSESPERCMESYRDEFIQEHNQSVKRGVSETTVTSIVDSEQNFQRLIAMLLECSGITHEQEKLVGDSRRAMDIYLPETGTAIELKTESSQRKGIGQALDYLRECSESLLIVPGPYADERIAESCENAEVEYGVLVADGFEYTLKVREMPQFVSEVDTDGLAFGIEELEEP